jgi:hypothetical protein
MAAGYSDQYLEQGSTFNTQLTLTDDYGNPYDLTGFTLAGRAKKSYNTANVAFVFSITTQNPTTGIITLGLSSAVTANVPYGKYVYDVTVTSPLQIVSRVLEGQIYVSPGVTGVVNSYGTDA